MEIERKFIIESFPPLVHECESDVLQGYLSIKPTVRIRRSATGENVRYEFCIKGKGTLSREEVEWEITQDEFERLSALLPKPPVRKRFRKYLLDNGYELECSLVDEGEPTSFMYAEVEFDSEEEARAFVPPEYLGRDITESSLSMSDYWRDPQAFAARFYAGAAVPDIILASQSPRRSELMQMAGFDFEVIVTDADESVDPSLSPDKLVEAIAARKADAVAAIAHGRTVVAADTIVVLDGKVFGKPHSHSDAHDMLAALAGRVHEVYTGVCIIRGAEKITFAECAKVEFYPLSDREIDDYIATGEPMDKAGAYGIQGRGAVLVKKIDGDFYTVMGLPIARVAQCLRG